MRFLTAALCLLLSACGGVTCYQEFSPGYDPRTSLENALPTIAMRPGETRAGMSTSPALGPFSRERLVSEDPRVVTIWKIYNAGDTVRFQALAPGKTLIHRGVFPYPNWNPKANPVERTAWRMALRKYLVPRPDDATFRAITDADLWKTIVRSQSRGALRVVVEYDRLQFWPDPDEQASARQ